MKTTQLNKGARENVVFKGSRKCVGNDVKLTQQKRRQGQCSYICKCCFTLNCYVILNTETIK